MRWTLLLMVAVAVHCNTTVFDAVAEVKSSYQDVCVNSSRYSDLICNCMRDSRPEFKFTCIVDYVDDTECVDGLCKCTQQRRLLRGRGSSHRKKAKNTTTTISLFLNITADGNISLYSTGICRNLPAVFYNFTAELPDEPFELSAGAIIGLSVFAAVVVIACCCVMYCEKACCFRRKVKTSANRSGFDYRIIPL